MWATPQGNVNAKLAELERRIKALEEKHEPDKPEKPARGRNRWSDRVSPNGDNRAENPVT
jgi:hypothetical protein